MFTLDQVVPWGRSFAEYRRMFALSEGDLQRRIVGCADGPASFNAELTRRGGRVVSCDPLYQFDREQIRTRIAAIYDQVLEQTQQHHEAFVWETIRDIDELAKVRMKAMEAFLADLEAGKRDDRYVAASLPELQLPDASFDLALCSHFLFLYTDHLSEAFHIQAIAEMCRVAAEVRIFPLLTLDSQPSRYLDAVLAMANNSGLSARIEPVRYEFQCGANRMLRITR